MEEDYFLGGDPFKDKDEDFDEDEIYFNQDNNDQSVPKSYDI